MWTEGYRNTGPIDCPIHVDYSKVKGRTVIVTGGSNGLGAAYTKAFAENGAFVVNGDINPPTDDFVAKNSIFVQCDVCLWEDQVELFETAVKKSPNHGIDIVIANAGIFKSDLFPDGLDSPTPIKPNLKIIEVNVNGVTYTANLAAHHFQRQKKRQISLSPTYKFDSCLILVGSIMSYIDTYGVVSYGPTKHAVRGLMGVLRRRGWLRVNMIAPWYTPSTIISPAFKESLAKQFAEDGLGFAEVEDAVKAVMRMATDENLNGRALVNVPRSVRASGYMDMDRDDFEEGSLVDRFQKSVAKIQYIDVTPPKEE